MRRNLIALSILFLFSISVTAQMATKSPDPKEPQKLEKDAVDFLRETVVDVGNMHSLENRISFAAELASLMWLHDEKEARGMYLSVASDFKQLLMEYDQQMNTISPAEQDDEDGPVGAISQKQLQRKSQTAITLRRHIALSLAEHEPEMALAFYYNSVAALSNPAFRNQTNDQDKSFEFQLMTLVAKTNVVKAVEFGKRSLDNGVTDQQIELLKHIYAKDAEKGADFASAIVASLKSNQSKDVDLSVYGSLLSYGDEISDKVKKGGGKRAVLSSSDLHDLTDVFAQKILGSDDESAVGFAELIGKYAPSRGIQLKAKAKRAAAANESNPTVLGPSPDPSVEVATVTSDDARLLKEVEEREAAENKLASDVQSLGTKEQPEEERDSIVKQARVKIAKTKGKDSKILALSALAAQVAKAGDKELAAEIMKDAERLVNLQPKNYQDFLLCTMLASGYAEVDPDKAFPLLTDTILRLNDTISGFVKAAEFIDVDGEIIDDGEFQVGGFGGSIMRDISIEMVIAQPTLRKLAIADFARTKALTNSFDRPEVRVLAKMLVLRAITGDKKKSSPDETKIGSVKLRRQRPGSNSSL